MYRIEKLNKSHNTKQFDCEKGSLNSFLSSYASQNAKRDYSQTYVAVEDGGDNCVLGYYSIACSSVEFEELPEVKHIPSEYPVPTILLAKLARHKGIKGLGSFLLLNSFARAVEVADMCGAHVYAVDAMDKDAKAFYESFDFRSLIDSPLRLFHTMKYLRKVVSDLSA